MVEVSPALKKIQKTTLKCNNKGGADTNADENTATTLTGTRVSWHSTLDEVPTGCKDASTLTMLLLFRLTFFPISLFLQISCFI